MRERYGQAKRLASTLNLPREQWLQLRQLGIGSSDAAAAVGLSPYKSALSLWLEKTGRKPAEDLSDKAPVFWGTMLEPVLAPVAYQCQVLHQLAVTGLDWADVAVLIGGQDFRIYRIERDDDKILDLCEREDGFWQQVTQDQQPSPDGSDDAGRALSWMFPRDQGITLDLSESMEANSLFGTLLALRAKQDDLSLLEAQTRQQLQNILGTASAAVFADGKVSWKKTKDRTSPDLDKLSADYPDLLPQYSKTVEGSRRFLIHTARSAA